MLSSRRYVLSIGTVVMLVVNSVRARGDGRRYEDKATTLCAPVAELAYAPDLKSGPRG